MQDDSFYRTLSGVQAQHINTSLALLIVTMIVVVAWLLWLFLAPLPVYGTSSSVQIAADGTVTATFPQDAVRDVRSGQEGTLILNDEEAGETPRIAVTISNIDYDSTTAQVNARPADEQATLAQNATFLNERVESELHLQTGTTTAVQLLFQIEE